MHVSRQGPSRPKLSAASQEIETLCRAGKLADANQRFRGLLQSGARGDKNTYDRLIMQNIHSGDLSTAYEIFQEGIKRRCVSECYLILYGGLVNSGMLAEALKVLKVINKHHKSVPSNARLALVSALYQEKKKADLTEIEIYSLILRQFAKIRDAKGADEAFSQISSPNQESCNLLLRAYARSVKFTDIGSALIFYESVKAAQCDEGSPIYKKALSDLKEAAKTIKEIKSRMKEIRDEMRLKDFSDDIETCNAFIEFYIRARQPGLAKKEFESSKGCSANAATYYSIFHQQMQLMKNSKDKRNEAFKEAYSALGELFWNDLRREPLMACYSAEKLLLKGFSALCNAYRSLIKSYPDERDGLLQKIVRLFELIKGETSNKTAYSIMVEIYTRAEKLREANKLIQEMQGSDATLCYHVFIDTCHDMRLMKQAYQAYEKSGIQFNPRRSAGGMSSIDFHGMSHGVAYIQFVKYLQTNPKFPFVIVPGKGVHNKNPESVMLDYLKTQFRRPEMQVYQYKQSNDGSTLVIMKPHK